MGDRYSGSGGSFTRQAAKITTLTLKEAREATEARTAVMAVALNIGTRAHSGSNHIVFYTVFVGCVIFCFTDKSLHRDT